MRQVDQDTAGAEQRLDRCYTNPENVAQCEAAAGPEYDVADLFVNPNDEFIGHYFRQVNGIVAVASVKHMPR